MQGGQKDRKTQVCDNSDTFKGTEHLKIYV